MVLLYRRWNFCCQKCHDQWIAKGANRELVKKLKIQKGAVKP